ncbi:hypothetical protein HU200_037972 [Digitaria exilis]|uniref:DC1 domain-containing protein n=1 Tax=Digitaria exilis TaxID=1010633 RepID=A0A835BPS1_9POAL|nr:hypothetical protein HU200_037972 [Digitaria exilis]
MSSRCVSTNARRLSGSRLPPPSPAEDAPETETSEREPEDDGEIVHFSHPEHRLARFDFPYLFMCMGCKEYGAGKRFMCQTCGFQLHEFCALAPPSLHDHPFHPKHPHLLFFVKPAGGFLRCKCDICGKAVKGFSFRCASCGFDMHPCCAAMERMMELPAAHEHVLVLAAQDAAAETSFVCQVCRRATAAAKRPGGSSSSLVYRCLPCGYCLHARCAKDMVNGLYAHGIVPPEKRSALATAARVTVNALFGVIGGLIEGIGEGIGEAFVENIGRSRRSFG